MRAVLVLMMVLSMATIANAALKISVNGVVDPPDTTIMLDPEHGSTAKIGIWGDGQTPQPQDAYLVIEGPATASGFRLLYAGSSLTEGFLYEPATEAHVASLNANMGFSTAQAYYFNFVDAVEPFDELLIGVLVDSMILHFDGPGDVSLTLGAVGGYENPDTGEWFYQFATFDTQIIHHVAAIPEPMTMGLLGLGGLFLRRRK